MWQLGYLGTLEMWCREGQLVKLLPLINASRRFLDLILLGRKDYMTADREHCFLLRWLVVNFADIGRDTACQNVTRGIT